MKVIIRYSRMGYSDNTLLPQGPADVYRKLLNWWPAPAATTGTLSETHLTATNTLMI
ncbi:MAG: hypothetical protein IPP71_06555 [Bacteroidetes bacterium]|nr:hypothetical protein [Bacteroidota bacterium]